MYIIMQSTYIIKEGRREYVSHSWSALYKHTAKVHSVNYGYFSFILTLNGTVRGTESKDLLIGADNFVDTRPLPRCIFKYREVHRWETFGNVTCQMDSMSGQPC